MNENSRTIAGTDTAGDSPHGTGQGPGDSEGQASLQQRLLLLPICIAVVSLSALGYYHLRREVTVIESPLQVIYSEIYLNFGLAPSVMFFLLLLVWTSIWFFSGKIERPWTRLGRLVATAVMLGVFLNIEYASSEAGTPFHPQQGELGAFLATRMVAAFGAPFSFILGLVATLGALLLATDFLFSDAFERVWTRARRDADAGKAAGDAGVEVAVTDHLKGLAAAAPPAAPIQDRAVEESAGRDDAAAAVVEVPGDELAEALAASNLAAEVEDEAGDFAADAGGEGEPGAEVRPDQQTSETRARARRRSYFERRHEEQLADRGAASAAAPDADPEGGAVEVPEPEFAADESPVDASPADAPVAEESPADEVTVAAVDTREPVGDPWFPAPEEQEIENPEFEPELVHDGEDLVQGVSAASAEPGAAEHDAMPTADLDAAATDEAPAPLDDDAAEPMTAQPASADLAEEVLPGTAADLDFGDDIVVPEAADTAPEPAVAADDERLFSIPRPPEEEPAPLPSPPQSTLPGSRQQGLFGSGVDEALIAEAQEMVLETRRVSAAFLRRRLRIDYDEACSVLAALSARGIIELDDDASQGRLVD